ncbi:hypothetical protein BGY98DRAFT_995807 [Russula aff. rugulosa BPL654]|nr:hypothetical protein BGY98DRAFT_995807 [Russula aff. rugulosa BPL654]
MDPPTQGRNTVNTRNGPFGAFGAGMMAHTPDRNRNRTQAGNARQRPKDQDEALMEDLEQREKSLNAVLISAGAISASVVYRIVYNIRNIHRVPQPFLYAAIHSHFSQATTSMAAPQPLPLDRIGPPPIFDVYSSRIVRMNVYWVTSLVFSVSAVVLAMLGKHMIRESRDRLALRGQLKPAPIHSPLDGSAQGLAMFAATDTMYRLFQVALVLVLVGHIDTLVISVGVTVFAPIVGYGVLYVFGFIGPHIMRNP